MIITKVLTEGYVIEMKHKHGDTKYYIAGIPTDDSGTNFDLTVFDTIGEASEYPYPTAEIAAASLGSLPATQEVDYTVVAAKDKP